jgi:hypothetical protein
VACKREYVTIAGLFLEDPETGEKLEVVSDIILEGEGKYSFIVANSDFTAIWKHTIRTEEIAYWVYQALISRVEEKNPEFKYKVGDKVVVQGLTIWGTGTIIEVNLDTSDNKPYIVCYPYFNGGEVKNMKYWVREEDIIYKDE